MRSHQRPIEYSPDAIRPIPKNGLKHHTNGIEKRQRRSTVSTRKAITTRSRAVTIAIPKPRPIQNLGFPDFSEIGKIFQKQEVTNSLGKLLSLEDLKNCRLVSKRMNGGITSSKSFLNRVTLRINQELIIDLNANVDNCYHLKKTKWKKIRVELSRNKKGNLDFEEFRSFFPIFKNVIDLTIGIHQESFVGKGKIGNFFPFLNSFKSLEKLALDNFYSSAFEKLIARSFQHKNEIRDIFWNISHFKIFCSSEEFDQVRLLQNWPIEEHREQQIFDALCNLKSFEVPGVTFCNRNPSFDSKTIFNVFFYGIFNFALQSESTIVNLDLNFGGFLDLDRICNVQFKNLRHLKLRELKPNVHKKFSFDFLSQISSLDKLQCLSLEIFNEYFEMPREILELVKRKCRNLEGLHLKAGKIAENWDFLALFKFLRRLSIFVPRTEDSHQMLNGENKNIISKLPEFSMEELSFRGLDFQTFDSLMTCGRKLTNLVRLNLLDCPGALDDQKLLVVVHNCEKLEVLQFSHCPNVTDFGLTGTEYLNDLTTMRNNMNSIQQLKRLKELRMICCQNITDFSCSDGIKFTNLNILDLSSPNKISSKISCKGIESILMNNPRLLELHLSRHLEIAISEYLGKGIHKFKNTRFYYLNVGGKLEDEDDDSDFDGTMNEQTASKPLQNGFHSVESMHCN